MTVEIGPMNATAVSDIHLTITIAIFDGRYLGKYTVSIDWLEVLRRIQHKIDHFGDFLPAKLLTW